MKVAHIVRRYARNEWGGTESVVSHIVKEQISRNIDAKIFFTSACQPADSHDGYGYFYPYWPLSAKNRLALDKKGGNPYSPSLFRAVRAFSPDIIHIHAGGRLASAAIRLAKKLGVPSVMTLHGGAAVVPDSEIREMKRPIRGKLRFGAILDRFFGLRFDPLERVTSIIAISRAEEKRLGEKYGREKVFYLPNGVSRPSRLSSHASWFSSLKDSKRETGDKACRILCVSRIDYQKNQLALVELLGKLPFATLTLVGPITAEWYADEIKKRVEELNLSERFRLVPGLPPESPELEAEYAKADVFILPSVHEPFGIVALEAMAHGIPLIASRVGGLPDFIRDGENGLLFDPAKKGGLERAFAKLVDKPSLAHHLVEEGLKTAAEYSWPKIVDRLMEMYASERGRATAAPRNRSVSILVRSHNEAPFLKRTLEAFSRQNTKRDVEVIVCDDGSTDESSKVIADSKARQVVRPSGAYRPGRTLNAMISAARGEIIVFNNADAVPVDGDWLENLIAPLECGEADVTFANQLPRPDATALVRKDSERAFGDGSVSKDWPRFFSLASSAALRSDLIANPFDETLVYSEDVEWANRRVGTVKRYVPSARVEHSHNYNAAELRRRFYGEGYADAQIFGDKPASLFRMLLGTAAESARDFVYLLKHLKDFCAIFSSPRRRWIQRKWHNKGVKDFVAWRLPRFTSTSEPSGRGILLTGVYPKFKGGLERFAGRLAELLRSRGHEVTVCGDPPEDARGYSAVLMNKLPRSVGALRQLKTQCGERLCFYAHDHELYCLRQHYYTPCRNNCSRTYSAFPCRFCAAVTRPKWIARALTRRMTAFMHEMRGVKIFAPSSFTREVLVKNGFAPDMVEVVAPFWVESPNGRAKTPASPLPKTNLAGSESRPLRILFAGQLIAGKGAAVLIEAMRHLDIPFVLTIIGGGKDEAKLKRLAKSLAGKTKGEIKFAGYVKDTTPFVRDADMMAFPSLWQEPFGLAGVEGFVHGVPCVGFDVGGVSDWLIDGETGLLVKERTPQALAAAIRKMADPALRAKLAEGARRFVTEHFGEDRFLASLGFAPGAKGGAR